MRRKRMSRRSQPMINRSRTNVQLGAVASRFACVNSSLFAPHTARVVDLSALVPRSGSVRTPHQRDEVTMIEIALRRRFSKAISNPRVATGEGEGQKANGHLDRLSVRFGAKHLLGGMANISAGLDVENRVVQFFPNHDLVFGEMPGGSSDRTRALENCFTNASFNGRPATRLCRTCGKSSRNWASAPGLPV
jgi:hypothetical protein